MTKKREKIAIAFGIAGKELLTKALLQEISSKKPGLKKIEDLIDRGADVNAIAGYGFLSRSCALVLASRKGHTDIIELLLKKGANINCRDEYYSSPLTAAIAHKQDAAIRLLIEKGAPMAGALVQAAKYWIAIDIFKQLIEKTPDVNKRNQALIHAARKGDIEQMELLLDSGCDINAKNKDGDTALIMAAHSIQSAAIEFLAQKNADINAVNNAGKTALIVALRTQSGSYTRQRSLKPDEIAIAHQLINLKPDVNAKDDYGQTALYLAALNNLGLTVATLYKAGARFEDAILHAHNDNNQEMFKKLRVQEERLTGKTTPITKDEVCLSEIFKMVQEQQKTIEKQAAELAALKKNQAPPPDGPKA